MPASPLSLLTADVGSYQVIVTNAYGSVTSAVAVLAIAEPPPAPAVRSG